MRDKIKLIIDFPPNDPDPPPFTCDVCGLERPGFAAAHRGRKFLCWHHARKKTAFCANMDWRDNLQIDAIRCVIGEIAHG